MKVFARDRQEGKTTELIKLAAAEFLYVVCVNQSEARRVAAEAKKLGLDIPFPLTWDEFVNQRYHWRGIKGFVIDNLDVCLQQMTPVSIRAVSLNVARDDAVAEDRR